MPGGDKLCLLLHVTSYGPETLLLCQHCIAQCHGAAASPILFFGDGKTARGWGGRVGHELACRPKAQMYLVVRLVLCL